MISIVIVDYNSEKLTRLCLDSLVALGRLDLAFVVVDNGGSVDAAGLEADFPGLSVIQPGENLGFAGGCNLGLARGRGDGTEYCLLLNPDTLAEQDFIAPLLSAMEADERLGIVCPTLLDADDVRDIGFGGGGINWWIGRPYAIRGRRLQSDNGVVPVPYATGAAMFLRMAAVMEVGPMDENYFLYFEDADYAQAFLRARWKIGYVPEGEILHAASSVTGFQSETYVRYFARNRILFMRRWANWPQWLVFLLFHSLVRLPGALIVFGLLRRRPGTALAFLRGWADGLAGR